MPVGRFQHKSSFVLFVAAMVTLVVSAQPSHGQFQFTRVLSTGDPAPGLPGATLDPVGGGAIPQVDNQGNIAVGVNVPGRPGFLTLGTLYITADQNADDVLLYPGMPAPGQESREVVVGDYYGLGLDGGFHANGLVWTEDQTNAENFSWIYTPNGFEILHREFDQAPGVSDPGVRAFPAVFHAGRGGQMVFSGFLAGPGINDSNRAGIWSQIDPDGPLQLVAREGDQVPGLPDGVHYVGNAALSPYYTVNRGGEVTFRAFLNGPGVDGTNYSAIMSGTPGNIGVVVRAGDPAEDAGQGVKFGDFAQLRLNDAGEHYFYSSLQGTGVTTDNDQALWHGTAGNLQLIAREGDHAVGMAPGVVFESFLANDMNESGAVLSVAAVRGAGIDETNDTGLWMGGPGDFDLILAEDDAVPGAANENVWFDIDGLSAGVMINARGDVVLSADLRGSDVTEDNDRGIWARPAGSEEWLKVLREGDDLDGRVVDRFLVELVEYPIGARPLNDDGLFAFQVTFTDFTSAIYTVVVPEPSCAVMICMGAALLVGRRRSLGATRLQ